MYGLIECVDKFHLGEYEKSWYNILGDMVWKGGVRMERDLFEEYIIQGEPDEKEKALAWSTAIGLQAVDGLKPSEYLLHTAMQNIEGNHTIQEVHQLLDSYYEEKPHQSSDDRTEEADKVSARIVEILSEKAFTFNTHEYLAIHRRLFKGIYSHAGQIRGYNITKKEWVLDGATILYGSASQLRETLEYDLELEKKFSYQGLDFNEILLHVAYFISRLWQIHVFAEGNTRTTVVFLIKYLRILGYDVENDAFAKNVWYFRNTLVRANYTDVKKNIYETTEFLEEFLKCLLLNQKKEFHNRNLHVRIAKEMLSHNVLRETMLVEDGKVNIEDKKVNIEDKKVNIEDEKMNILGKTEKHIRRLYAEYSTNTIFGSKEVGEFLGLGRTGAYKLIKKMIDMGLVEQVLGHGKGRYRFIVKE